MGGYAYSTKNSSSGLRIYYSYDIKDSQGNPLQIVKDKNGKWWTLDKKTGKFTFPMSRMQNTSNGRLWNDATADFTGPRQQIRSSIPTQSATQPTPHKQTQPQTQTQTKSQTVQSKVQPSAQNVQPKAQTGQAKVQSKAVQVNQPKTQATAQGAQNNQKPMKSSYKGPLFKGPRDIFNSIKSHYQNGTLLSDAAINYLKTQKIGDKKAYDYYNDVYGQYADKWKNGMTWSPTESHKLYSPASTSPTQTSPVQAQTIDTSEKPRSEVQQSTSFNPVYAANTAPGTLDYYSNLGQTYSDNLGQQYNNFNNGYDYHIQHGIPFSKQGGKMYKYQEGGAAPSPEEQVAQLVQAAQQGDKEAQQKIQQIQQAAQGGDQQAQQIMQMIQQIMQQAQSARQGAKLNYIKRLKGLCEDDEDLVFMKRGGKVCKVCQKKQQQQQQMMMAKKKKKSNIKVEAVGGPITNKADSTTAKPIAAPEISKEETVKPEVYNIKKPKISSAEAPKSDFVKKHEDGGPIKLSPMTEYNGRKLTIDERAGRKPIDKDKNTGKLIFARGDGTSGPVNNQTTKEIEQKNAEAKQKAKEKLAKQQAFNRSPAGIDRDLKEKKGGTIKCHAFGGRLTNYDVMQALKQLNNK